LGFAEKTTKWLIINSPDAIQEKMLYLLVCLGIEDDVSETDHAGKRF